MEDLIGRLSGRRAAALALVLAAALLHLLPMGSLLPVEWRRLHSSYFSDLVIPFAFYFLLALAEERHSLLRPWRAKWTIALAVPCFLESAQAFGIPALGSTFDRADYLMYALGASAAMAVDRGFLDREGAPETPPAQ